MKKVLIISYAFPPQNEIASRRFAEMLPYFESNGWKPFVLTTFSQGDLNPQVSDKQIIRVGNHPGLQVEKSYRNIFLSKLTVLRKHLGFSFRVFGPQLFSWSQLVLSDSALIEKLKQENFTCIIASYGPPSALRLGHYLSKLLNTPIVYDFRDLGALHEGDEYSQNIVAQSLDRLFEKKYLKNASALTTVSYGLAEKLAKHYRVKTEVIYNGWAPISYALPERSGLLNVVIRKPFIYYAGRFYEHRLDAIYCLLQSIKNTPYYLVLRSLGPEYLESKIIAYAKLQNVADRVIVLPPATATVVNYEQTQSAVNLVVEDLDNKYPTKKGVLTGKFLQLLTLTAPVLAIARSDSEIGSILDKTAKGRLVSNAEQLAIFFEQVTSKPGLYSKGEAIVNYSKERQAAKLCRLLDGLII